MAEREWLICEAHKWGLPQIALSRQLKGSQITRHERSLDYFI